MAYDHIVYIVDDDRSVRESLLGLLDSFGMNALAFGSVADGTELALSIEYAKVSSDTLVAVGKLGAYAAAPTRPNVRRIVAG